MTPNDKLLELRNATVVFHLGGLLERTRLVAVNDVSFSLSSEMPEIFALAGESGSGKTTLSRLLLNDLNPTSGNIFFEGRDLAGITGRTDRMAFMRKVQPVFQNPFETFSPLRTLESYLFDTALNFGMASTRQEAATVVDEKLQLVGLSLAEVSKRYPHELSGGQLQRVSVARALIPNPRVILADEPVSMVDASLRMEIVNLFGKLRDEQRVSVIFITHDLGTAYYISDRIAIMLRGFIVEMGPVREVLEKPLHPYTQLLKDSVPDPDPADREAWASHITLGVTEVKEYNRVGCKFAARCPHVMDICHKADPPDVVVDGRTVKCYLYTDPAAYTSDLQSAPLQSKPAAD